MIKVLVNAVLYFIYGVFITLMGYYDIEFVIIIFVIQCLYFLKWGKTKITKLDIVVLILSFVLLLLFHEYNAERGRILLCLNPDTPCEPSSVIWKIKGLGYFFWMFGYIFLISGIITDFLYCSPKLIDNFERERN